MLTFTGGSEDRGVLGLDSDSILFRHRLFRQTDRCWGSDGFLERRIPGKSGEVSLELCVCPRGKWCALPC